LRVLKNALSLRWRGSLAGRGLPMLGLRYAFPVISRILLSMGTLIGIGLTIYQAWLFAGAMVNLFYIPALAVHIRFTEKISYFKI
jgi:hypothetical protein